MPVPGSIAAALTFAIVTMVSATATPPEPALQESGASLIEPATALPGEGLPTIGVRRYSMSGYVRPLLFWFGREDIGLARVVWRSGEGGARGYELLVGTDPAKAPRAINRWGFVSEEVHGREGAVLALMTGSDDTSYDEAAAGDGLKAASDFRAIRSEIRNNVSEWQVVRLQAANNFSVHDVDAAVAQVRRATADEKSRQEPIADSVRPGFLVALADLIERGAARGPDTDTGRRVRDVRVRYAFGRGLYELRVREAERTTLLVHGRPTPAIRSAFEIRTLATDARTRFDVTFGADGAMKDVPIAAAWQPRWWLKVALQLADSDPG